jgi:hypothetical protein
MEGLRQTRPGPPVLCIRARAPFRGNPARRITTRSSTTRSGPSRLAARQAHYTHHLSEGASPPWLIGPLTAQSIMAQPDDCAHNKLNSIQATQYKALFVLVTRVGRRGAEGRLFFRRHLQTPNGGEGGGGGGGRHHPKPAKPQLEPPGGESFLIKLTRFAC